MDRMRLEFRMLLSYLTELTNPETELTRYRLNEMRENIVFCSHHMSLRIEKALTLRVRYFWDMRRIQWEKNHPYEKKLKPLTKVTPLLPQHTETSKNKSQPDDSTAEQRFDENLSKDREDRRFLRALRIKINTIDEK